jgi:glucosyl-dolichyl phosphate glucuronosyltransferase
LKISVIISTYSPERLDSVLECISSLNQQTMQPDEIILVLDPDDKLVKFYASHINPPVKVIVSEEKGLSNARNAGINGASGDIVAFIDDDAIADKNWLSNLTKNYVQPNFLGAGGLIEPVWEIGRPAWFPEELDWLVGCTYKGLPVQKSYVRNPIGCNMSFRKNVFQKVGYFKTHIGRTGGTLVGSEEAEFSARLLNQIPEAKIIFDPSAVVYHKVPRRRASFSYSMKRSFYEGVSKKLMQNVSANSPDLLSVEKNYATYILEVAIPLRLKRIHRAENIMQLFIIVMATSLVVAGYISDFKRAH